MFRVTRFMQELREPTPLGPARASAAPVVIWNLIRRCNLSCLHCYSISSDKDFPNELSTDEVLVVMRDLRAFGVPALILSGGEPLLRRDLFEIAAHARQMRFYVGLSTNGTLIDDALARRIAAARFDYVGISLDGIGATHDRFRGKPGAFDASVGGMRRLMALGIKVGVRFTITRDNAEELPALLRFVEDEGVDKFYLSHLNYAGRGNRNREHDAALAMSRRAMDQVFEACWESLERGTPKEFVTGNNDADGVYFLHWAALRFPERAAHLRAKLAQWGGNSSGVGVANIDNLGWVHPDTMWWDYRLGNVRERPFSEIWQDTRDPIMAGLKQRPRPVKGRCGACAHLELCNGNTRVRARRLTGDAWAEDPACYLCDAEIGLSEAPEAEAAA